MKKETKSAISSLDWVIAQTIEEPRHPDEFTSKEYADRMGISPSVAKDRLNRFPGIAKRSVTLNGTKMNLYRRA